MRDQGPLEIRPSEFKTFDAALRKFRKLVEKEGLLKKVVEREHGFKKPSLIRHQKRRRAKLLNKQNNTRRKHSEEIPIYSK